MQIKRTSGRITNRRNNACLVEPIEPRLLMAGHVQDIGTLNGRFFRQGSVFGSDTDAYHFHVSQPGNIDVQLSRQIGTGKIVLKNSTGSTVASTSASSDDRRVQFQALFAGDFTLEVRADQNQLFPADFYTLAISTDFAVNGFIPGSLNFSTAGAHNLGTLNESSHTTFRDFVGYLDTDSRAAADLVDVYKFDIPSFGDTSINLNGIVSDVADGSASNRPDIAVYHDRNGNGQLEHNELIGPGGGIEGDLGTGTTFLVVGAPGVFQPIGHEGSTIGGTNYTLDIAYHHIDLAGNTLATASAVTLGAGTTTRFDLLGPKDTIDIYKFDVTDKGPFNFDATLSVNDPSAANFDIDLVRDTNNDGVADVAPLRGFPAPGNLPFVSGDHVSRVLTDPGRYFLRVKRVSGESGYFLTMSAPSADGAGNTLGTAKNLGVVNTPSNSAPSFSDFVGRIDSADIYRISTGQRGEMRVNLTNVLSGDVTFDVIRDANFNGQIDAGEILAARSIGHVLDGIVLPQPGSYFVRVRPGPNNRDVNYNLNLNFSPQLPFNNTTPITVGNGDTRIEAELFDNGGEGVAFHDTDPADGPSAGVDFRSDTGVDLRTTNDPLGGNFRLATTKVGEFLVYTVNVPTAGLFNFDYRVSSDGSGATFHMEVDGDDVTGPVVIPDTHGVDNMTTIPSGIRNVSLAAGPHVFRIAFDRQTGGGNGRPDIAGTMNFFTVHRV